jgi:hypothetical protein
MAAYNCPSPFRLANQKPFAYVRSIIERDHMHGACPFRRLIDLCETCQHAFGCVRATSTSLESITHLIKWPGIIKAALPDFIHCTLCGCLVWTHGIRADRKYSSPSHAGLFQVRVSKGSNRSRDGYRTAQHGIESSIYLMLRRKRHESSSQLTHVPAVTT